MNSQLKNKITLQQRVGSLVSGTQKHYPTGSVTFGGATYDVGTLVQLLQGLANAVTASDAAKAKWNDALKSMRDETAKVEPVVRDYQSFLVATFGNAPSTLADFGLSPRKANTPPNAQQKAAAVAKRTATRAARHTMGPKARKTVKGNVTDVVMTPVVAAAPPAQSPATPAAPSPAASPSGSTPRAS